MILNTIQLTRLNEIIVNDTTEYNVGFVAAVSSDADNAILINDPTLASGFVDKKIRVLWRNLLNLGIQTKLRADSEDDISSTQWLSKEYLSLLLTASEFELIDYATDIQGFVDMWVANSILATEDKTLIETFFTESISISTKEFDGIVTPSNVANSRP